MINDIFSDNEVKEKRKKILLIDFSAISHATFHICRNDQDVFTEEDMIGLWRHKLLNSILTRKMKVLPDEVVICLDHGSWRNEKFKYYKARRKADKPKSDVNYDFFYKASDLFIEQIKESIPWKVISTRKAEGDDILAILAYHLHRDNDVVVMTSDKDMKQLLRIPNVKYYSYRNDQYETLDNPHEFLLRQILHGDKDDDIPNVKSPDNCFVAGIRQKQCGPVLIDKILEQGIEEYIKQEGLEENYKRNRNMIELSEETIPEKIWNSVIEKYDNYEEIKPDFMKIAQFLHENNLKILQNRINDFF